MTVHSVATSRFAVSQVPDTENSQHETTYRLCRILTDERAINQFLQLKDYHEPTAQHSLRVSLFAMRTGIELGMSESEVRLLGYAGLLHDVGKQYVPRAILDKPAKPTPQERLRIEGHPLAGYAPLLKAFPDMPVLSMVCRDHHCYQTNPYPHGPRERNTAEHYTQVIAVADMFDALRHKRVYQMHEQLNDREALDVVQGQYTGEQRYIRALERVLDA